MEGSPDPSSSERRLSGDRRGPDRRAIETRRVLERGVESWPFEFDRRTEGERRVDLERRSGLDRRLERDRRDMTLRT